MKTNKAPEKIYIDTDDNLSDSILYGFVKKDKDDDIEYIRKDVFIEKTSTWFANRYQVNGYLDADDIEDFISYMKGD